jgi:hypothetical protein
MTSRSTDYEFDLDGLRDSPEDMAENVNDLSGKRLMMAVRDGFVAAGYACDTVDAEDWGWYFYAVRNGARYLCGGQTDQGETTASGRVFVQHERGLFDRLRGRNRPDPDERSGKDLRDSLAVYPEISNLRAAED